MRKRTIPAAQEDVTQEDAAQPTEPWLDLEALAEVEITSEDPDFPVEGALVPGAALGWRAAAPGEQTIRLLFTEPQRLTRIVLEFEEADVARTQEFVLRWTAAGAQVSREIVRQQWNFSPQGATREVEDVRTELPDVAALELVIVPDVSGGDARASLRSIRLG